MLSKIEIIDQIRAEHRKRVFLIKQRVRIGNSLGAFVRTQLGWSLDLPEKEREAIKKRADKILKDRGEGTEFEWLIAANDAACAKFDEAENDIEKTLKKLVRQLPVWRSWAQHVIGLSELGVATIVGEAGDLSNYPKKGHLYKRMGVGFVNGARQGGLPSTASAAEWIEHGYNRQRRSRLYAYVGVPFIKCVEQENRKASPYRLMYDKRKIYEVTQVEARGMTVSPAAKIPKAEADRYVSEKCIHFRAQRYMEQRLLRDLWKAWKRADGTG